MLTTHFDFDFEDLVKLRNINKIYKKCRTSCEKPLNKQANVYFSAFLLLGKFPNFLRLEVNNRISFYQVLSYQILLLTIIIMLSKGYVFA